MTRLTFCGSTAFTTAGPEGLDGGSELEPERVTDGTAVGTLWRSVNSATLSGKAALQKQPRRQKGAQGSLEAASFPCVAARRTAAPRRGGK